MTDEILVETRDDVAVITLNRPAALNAWNMQMQDRVRDRVLAMSADDSVRGIVFTGAGEKAFCAGQDLAETAEFDPEGIDRWLENFRALYEAVLHVDKPVVAAINGIAAGSGYQFTLLCDVRVAHPGVRMGQTEVSSGIPSITGMYLTERAVGTSRTLELMLSARLMEIDELRSVGLVHHVVPREEVLTTAIGVVHQIAALPTVAVALTKERYREILLPGLRDAYAAAARIDRHAWASGQPQQVMREFFVSRKARKAAADVGTQS
jgi:enoyl-CoA hydratase/carnithine racemase